MPVRQALVFSVLVAVLAGLSLGGCSVVVMPPDPNDANEPNMDANEPPPPPASVTLRLINASDVTLDPEVYVSADAADAAALLVAGNKFTAFGIGTIGILAAGGSADVMLVCDEVTILGTTGGRFGENLNAPDGAGQQIVLRLGESVFCGDTVTITYSRTEPGFQTSFGVTR